MDEFDEREWLSRFKVGKNGDLVDLTKLDREGLEDLLNYYEERSRRARSAQMKTLHKECADDISTYLYEGRLPAHIDPFTIARQMGIKDIRYFIRSYLGNKATLQDHGYQMVQDHFATRKKPYTGYNILKDNDLARIFKLTEKDKLQDALNILIQFYKTRNAKVVLNSERNPDSFLFYDFKNEKIIFYVEELQTPLKILWALLLGFFEHMAASKSWRFHTNPEVCHAKQREEAEAFAKKVFDRYVEMGFLSKKKS